MELWFVIAAGGAAGALLRGALLQLAAKSTRASAGGVRVLDPALAILVANALGCGLLGAWSAYEPAAAGAEAGWLPVLVVTGICGGLTTFSTLCGDTLRLARDRTRGAAVGYLTATTALGFGAFLLGRSLVL